MRTSRLVRSISISLSVFAFSIITAAVGAPSAHAANAVLGVTQITATQTFATADGTYADGWKWVFDVTVPANQTLLKMKFADWTNGTDIIPAGGNMQFFSAQSLNASDETTAIPITASGAYSGIMYLDPSTDLDVLQGGRQIEITVETRVPTGSAGGSYSTSYGINTTATSSIIFGDLTKTYNGAPQPVTLTTSPLGLSTSVTYDGSTTPPTEVGSYTVAATVTDPGYTGTSSATLVISPAPVSVVADPKTKAYDGATSTDPALTYEATPPLFGSDTFTGALSRDPGENVGSYTINQGDLALDGDYILTYSPSTFMITPATAAIHFTGLEQIYDKVGKSVNVTTTPPDLSVDITYDGSSELPVNAGDYTVVATIDDANYVGVATDTMAIDPAPLTVTATTSTKIYDATVSSDGIPAVTSGTFFGADTAAWSQHFDNKNVGTDKSLIATGTISDGNGGHNYVVTFVDDTTGEITPASATVTATGINKVYDGTTAASATLSALGAVGGDALTAHDTATFDTKDVGDNKIVTVTGITVTGPGVSSADYIYNTSATTTADITPASLTITAKDETKAYGQAFPFNGTQFTESGLAAADMIDAVVLTSDGAAAGASITGSPYPIVPSDATGTGLTNYTIAYENGSLTITPGALTATITANSKQYDGTTDATINDCSLAGIVGTDQVTCSATNASFANKNVGTGKTVTADIHLSGTDTGNYTVNPTATAAADITALPITVTAATDSKTYDGGVTSSGVPAITSSTTLASSDSATFSQTFDSRNAGARSLIPSVAINDGNGGNNYSVTLVNAAGTINQLAITVTAQPNVKTYDTTTSASAVPSVSPSLASGDSASFIETYDTADAGTGKTLTPSGSVQDGNAGANYNVTFVSNTSGEIDKANQVVTFDPSEPLVITSGRNFTVTATSNSGLPVSFYNDGGAPWGQGTDYGVCQVAPNGVVTITGAGICRVYTRVAGNIDYNESLSNTIKAFTIIINVN